MLTFPRSFVRELIAIAVSVASLPSIAGDTHEIPIEPYRERLRGLSVSFLARDLSTGAEYLLDGSDLDTRHVPWSTFKIPNLVLALETGVAPSLEAWRDWDPEKRPAASHWPAEWQEGQDLGTAFARSSVWYFQDVALEIGTDAYRTKLSEWKYGDAVVPNGSDDFWLGGGLTISVREQVDFLDKLVSGELGVSDSSLGALATASAGGEIGSATLHGKTGSGPDYPGDTDGAFSGWYAGYLTWDNRSPMVFALHVRGPSFSSIRDFRRAFTVQLLENVLLAAGIP